jgi:outer membrane protein assembly factor BamD
MTQRLACLLLMFALAFTAGCATNDTADPTETARRIYERADGQMRNGNFAAAIQGFELLTAVYPFSEEARQAQLSLLYVYWRNDQPDATIAAADRFMLENPTHPRIDYALYVKGLAHFPRDAGPLERLFRVNMDKRPPGTMQSSFNSFQQLLRQHPNSIYVEDARQRMIYLRNRLAAHEVEVAEFYLARNAHVAAINRARFILENYQETPSVVPALRIMARGYDNLDMPDLAEGARRVLAENGGARRP